MRLPPVILIALLATLPVAATTAEPAEPTAQVVDFACDRSGNLTSLAISVDRPGIVMLRWDNTRICRGSV